MFVFSCSVQCLNYKFVCLFVSLFVSLFVYRVPDGCYFFSCSVCLTIVSTVLGLATMPLNKLLYVRSWSDELVVIPYLNIGIAIICTWVPTAIGMAIRRKFVDAAEKIKKVRLTMGMSNAQSTLRNVENE